MYIAPLPGACSAAKAYRQGGSNQSNITKLDLQNSSIQIQNSSFLIHNSSFLMHNFSFLIQNSSLFLTLETFPPSFCKTLHL